MCFLNMSVLFFPIVSIFLYEFLQRVEEMNLYIVRPIPYATKKSLNYGF
jgi:hypothetical protein